MLYDDDYDDDDDVMNPRNDRHDQILIAKKTILFMFLEIPVVPLCTWNPASTR
jgi:hypothetical protein